MHSRADRTLGSCLRDAERFPPLDHRLSDMPLKTGWLARRAPHLSDSARLGPAAHPGPPLICFAAHTWGNSAGLAAPGPSASAPTTARPEGGRGRSPTATESS